MKKFIDVVTVMFMVLVMLFIAYIGILDQCWR